MDTLGRVLKILLMSLGGYMLGGFWGLVGGFVIGLNTIEVKKTGGIDDRIR